MAYKSLNMKIYEIRLLYSKKINKSYIHDSILNVNICILNWALIMVFGFKLGLNYGIWYKYLTISSPCFSLCVKAKTQKPTRYGYCILKRKQIMYSICTQHKYLLIKLGINYGKCPYLVQRSYHQFPCFSWCVKQKPTRYGYCILRKQTNVYLFCNKVNICIVN